MNTATFPAATNWTDHPAIVAVRDLVPTANFDRLIAKLTTDADIVLFARLAIFRDHAASDHPVLAAQGAAGVALVEAELHYRGLDF